MTFTEVQTLLKWAHDNRVAQIKIGETVEATFYPDKELPANIPASSQDMRKRIDSLLGVKFENESV